MRLLVQRVERASVRVEGREIASIQRGLLVFVGIAKDDDNEDLQYLANKVMNLRIFDDDLGKMNLSVRQLSAEVLSVPQFTLYADTSGGNRPGFEESAEPIKARKLWEDFNSLLVDNGLIVKAGDFGAHMEVDLVNDGPVTIWLDSAKKQSA